jgi:tRNA uridine 5-carbamoylmethylation protein Kti12
MYEMTSFGDKWTESCFDSFDEFLVKHVERKILEHLLQNHEKVLIDNTSISSASRKAYVSSARQMNSSVGIVFLNTPPGVCLERNQQHEDKIPDTIISNLSAEVEVPQKSEGFAEVVVLDSY